MFVIGGDAPQAEFSDQAMQRLEARRRMAAARVSVRRDILFERRGAAGLITLNRPQALNAVTHAMVLALARAARRLGR